MSQPFDLTSATEAAIAFRDERDWEQFHSPKNLASGIAIEAAELLEVFLWEPVLPAADIRLNERLMDRVREELADVLVYSLTLAHDLDIDLGAAIATKIARNGERYPAEQVRGSSRKASHHENGSAE